MRVIELLVDGQRVKLTTDENILRAVERGDLKPDSRVVITEHDEEVFVGQAIRDVSLAEIFPAHMKPRINSPTNLEGVNAPRLETLESYGSVVPTSQTAQAQPSAPAPAPAPAVPLSAANRSVEPVRVSETVVPSEPDRSAIENVMRPRPWRHWVGKFVDVNFLVLAAILAASITQQIMDPYGYGYLWLGVPAFFIIDGLMMCIFGGSLGKLLVNIQVRKHGKNIGPISGTKRSIHSHVVGAALWIPFLSILTMLGHYGKLKANGRSQWDIAAGNAVYYGPIGFLRWICIILFLSAYALLTLVVAANS